MPMTKNGWWVSVPGARRVRALHKHPLYMYSIYIQIYFQAGKWTNEIIKPQVTINSNNSSTDCRKTATGNGNLQSEIESNRYSSSKKLPE